MWNLYVFDMTKNGEVGFSNTVMGGLDLVVVVSFAQQGKGTDVEGHPRYKHSVRRKSESKQNTLHILVKIGS